MLAKIDSYGYHSSNALTRRRDSHVSLDDVRIIDINDIQPMSPDKIPPIIPKMGRKMGENEIMKRRYGNVGLWDNTPVSVNCPAIVGDPDILDITDILAEFDSVGWTWNRASNCLKAFLTSAGKTYVVKIPLKRLQRIFNKHIAADNGTKEYFREKSVDGFFKKLGRGLKKLGKHVVKSTIKGITAPVRFIKNPKKFIKDTGNDIKKLVKGVGKTALKVASSPVFGGIMAAMAAVPPLTAIGGVGLAAFAAANAIKPAFKAAEKGIDAIDALGKKKPGKALNILTNGENLKADNMAANFKANFNTLPAPAKKLMTSALKSTEDKLIAKKGIGKLAIQFKPKFA